MENKLPPKEKEVEKLIMKGVRFYGGYCQKVHSGKMLKSYVPKFGPKRGQKVMYCVKLADEGTPDILSCVPVKITKDMVGKTIGAFVAIEVKRSAGEVRSWERSKDERATNQKIQHRIIRKSSGIVLVAASLNEVLKDIAGVPKKILNQDIR